MGGRPFGVAWYHLRATLHRDWSGYLALILLVGLVGGVAMGAIAGARRTQSAFPNFLATSNASDLQFQLYSSQSLASLAGVDRELKKLPQVLSVGIAPTLYVVPLNASGRASLSSTEEDEISTIGSIDGEYVTQDRVAVVAGRMADPANVHEMLATPEMAKLAGWHVGQTVTMGDFTVAQVNQGFDPATVKPALTFTATLVGLVVFSNEVANDDIDRFPTYQLLTPALTRRLEAGATYPNYGLRLRGGERNVATVEREIAALVPTGTPYSFHETAVTAAQVERASKPEAIALGVFGAVAALAALLIAGQAISRNLWAKREDLNVMRALGADRATAMAGALLGSLVAVVVGAALAVALAIALSPLAPLGPPRQVDRTPGFAPDWTVLGLGCALLIGGLGLLAVGLSYRRVGHPELVDRLPPVSRRSTVVDTAARAGLSAPAVAGLRFSFERGHGRSAVPVRSVLVAGVLAVVVVVATLTFASGLRTLVSRPSLYGWNWSYAIDPVGGDNVPSAVTRLLGADPDVAAWTGFNYGDVNIDGLTVPELDGATHSPLRPPLLSGHEIRSKDQIVLGGATLAALHKKLGQTVQVSYGSPKNAPLYVPPRRMVIVGTVTMPAIGTAGTLHPSMGTGALFSDAILPAAFQRALTNRDPNLNGPAIAVVRLRHDVDPAAALASLHRIAAAGDRVLARDPAAFGDSFVVLGVQRPGEIVNYQSTGATPEILAGGLALGAVVALALTLGASVRRRRRDVALLKTLGFTRRQLAVAVAWEASVVAFVGVLIGVPVGIILGRWLWILFARDIYAVPSPTVPVLQIVVVGLAAFVLANAVAALPGRMAARTPTALVLRAE